LESSLNDKLVATLAPVVGTGKVKAAISVDYEVGTSETTQELYDPNTVAIVNSQTSVERQSGDDQQDQGVPGTPSNVPGSTGQPAANKADSQTASTDDDIQKTENKTYAVSKTMRHLTEPSGTIRKISAAVLVDDAVEVSTVNGRKVETRRKRSSEEMKQILDVATMAIGIDAARGDRITVQNLSFVAFPDETEFHPTWNTRVVRVVQDWSTLLKYLGIIAVCFVFYLTFLKPLRNRVVASFAESKPALAGGRVHDALPDIAQGRDRGDRSAFGNPLADISHELSEGTSDVKRAVVLKRHLVDKIKTEPVAASRLIEDWVRQSEA
jgi:flagellar M-ring protein FliF